MTPPWRRALDAVRRRLPSLALFALCFGLLRALAFAPVVGAAGRALVGRPVIDSVELVSFFLSFRGLLSLLFGTSVFVTLYFMEQTGLTAILLGALHEVEVSASDALRLVGSRSAALLRLAVGVLGRLALYLLPFLLITGALAYRLLSTRDINYYLAFRPPEWIRALAIVGVAGLVTLAFVVRKLISWRLVLHATAFEGAGPSAALRRSDELMHRDWRRLVGYWVIIWGVSAALAAAGAWLAQQAGLTMLALLAGRTTVGALIVVAMLGVGALIQAVISAARATVDASVFAVAFDDLREDRPEPLTPLLERVAEPPDDVLRGHGRFVALGLALALFVAGAVMAYRVTRSLAGRPPVAVTAHRGSSSRAPENTLASIRLAIEDSADYAEIDVLETKDGAVVLVHDADLARVGGVPRRVIDMTLAEVQAVDVGSWMDSSFRDERVPTLDQALELARGRIGVNIELKYFPGEQKLADRVVEAVHRQHMEDEVVIQSLTYRGIQRVRELDPELKIGYLMSVEVRDPSRLDVDFYSAHTRLISPAFVAQAHRRGRDVLAWTVQDSVLARRMATMGVDNLITSDPPPIRRALQSMGKLANEMQRLRAWLGG